MIVGTVDGRLRVVAQCLGTFIAVMRALACVTLVLAKKIVVVATTDPGARDTLISITLLPD